MRSLVVFALVVVVALAVPVPEDPIKWDSPKDCTHGDLKIDHECSLACFPKEGSKPNPQTHWLCNNGKIEFDEGEPAKSCGADAGFTSVCLQPV